MTAPGRLFREVSAELARLGFKDVELYLKKGRSRRIELTPVGHPRRRVEQCLEVRSEEAGWAARAGGPRGSIFACGTGVPLAGGPWPEPRGEPLRLPAARPPHADDGVVDVAPLIVESEALDRLAGFERVLAGEVAGARLVRAVVEDGSSEARLLSSRGVDRESRSRTAAVYLEVAAGDARRAVQLAAPAAIELDFEAQARRLGTLLSIGCAPGVALAGSAPMVIAPAVGARILAGLLPLLVGGDGWRFSRSLRDREGRLGADLLSVIDDGSLAGGVLRAATDGEGVPTKAVRLIDDGLYRQPLLSWHEAPPGRGESSGCMLRPSWRQPPEPGPTHLYIEPLADVAPAALVGSVTSGYYWLDALGGGRFDLQGDRFELPVCGFRLQDGRASEPVPAALVHGSIGELLRGVSGVGRDLTFYPHRYLLGSPTLVVEGLQLDGGPVPG